MAAFLRRAFDYPSATIDYFADDDTSIFEADINSIAKAGVTLGCNPPGNTRYCPKDLVKRDQMASFFARALGLPPIYPPPPPPPPEKPVTFGAGTWIVGVEIPADTFRNSGFISGCYWARLSGFSGELDDINANYFGSIRQIVEIAPTDIGFETTNSCGIWSSDLTPIKAPTTPLTPGIWQVGSEAAPGTWRNAPTDTGCYWARLSGFRGELEDIIVNDFIGDASQSVVTISASDVGFETTPACGTWTYLGP
jgi:hypothetical protein